MEAEQRTKIPAESKETLHEKKEEKKKKKGSTHQCKPDATVGSLETWTQK